jgi:hypothetical protein
LLIIFITNSSWYLIGSNLISSLLDKFKLKKIISTKKDPIMVRHNRIRHINWNEIWSKDKISYWKTFAIWFRIREKRTEKKE